MGKRGPKAPPFWTQVKFGPNCWEWTAGRFQNGYGRTFRRRSGVGAHRAIYEDLYGPIPEGLVVMHVCDNKPCVRPSHLRLGTPGDNMRDMIAKGRGIRGSAQKASKLSEDEIPVIRARLSEGDTIAAVARAYRVSETAIRSIKQGRTWTWA